MMEELEDYRLSGFGEDYIKHPLANCHIFEIIAHQLPFKDLLNCKKVCRFLNNEVNGYEKRIITKSVVVVENGTCINTTRGQKRISELRIIRTYQSLLSEDIKEIQRKFGAKLHKLVLEDCPMRPSELHGLLLEFPNLDSIEIRNLNATTILNMEDHNPFDILCAQVFPPILVLPSLRALLIQDPRPIEELQWFPETFPNLEFLKIIRLGDVSPVGFHGGDERRWSKLDSFCVTLGDEKEQQDSQLQSLSLMGLKLRKLTMSNIGGHTMKGKLISNFLKPQKKTLEYLKLTTTTTTSSQPLPFMVDEVIRNRVVPYYHFPSTPFPQLKTLEIDPQFITSLPALLRFLPNLQQLTCKCSYILWWWKVLKGSRNKSHHKNLKDISVGAIDRECLRKLGTILPNVCKLDMTSCDKSFHLICSSFFPNLQHL